MGGTASIGLLWSIVSNNVLLAGLGALSPSSTVCVSVVRSVVVSSEPVLGMD